MRNRCNATLLCRPHSPPPPPRVVVWPFRTSISTNRPHVFPCLRAEFFFVKHAGRKPECLECLDLADALGIAEGTSPKEKHVHGCFRQCLDVSQSRLTGKKSSARRLCSTSPISSRCSVVTHILTTLIQNEHPRILLVVLWFHEHTVPVAIHG